MNFFNDIQEQEIEIYVHLIDTLKPFLAQNAPSTLFFFTLMERGESINLRSLLQTIKVIDNKNTVVQYSLDTNSSECYLNNELHRNLTQWTKDLMYFYPVIFLTSYDKKTWLNEQLEYIQRYSYEAWITLFKAHVTQNTQYNSDLEEIQKVGLLFHPSEKEFDAPMETFLHI